jgi:hypothetical protein
LAELAIEIQVDGCGGVLLVVGCRGDRDLAALESCSYAFVAENAAITTRSQWRGGGGRFAGARGRRGLKDVEDAS